MRLPVGDAVTLIPGLPGRKKLTFRNVNSGGGGQDCFWGYEPAITANLGDANCGVPLHADEGFDFGDADGDQSRPVYFRCSTGTSTIVYYTEG